MLPPGPVARPGARKFIAGTQTPPLKGALIAEKPSTSVATSLGSRRETVVVTVVPSTIEPTPTRCGRPKPPASAWPRSAHLPIAKFAVMGGTRLVAVVG